MNINIENILNSIHKINKDYTEEYMNGIKYSLMRTLTYELLNEIKKEQKRYRPSASTEEMVLIDEEDEL